MAPDGGTKAQAPFVSDVGAIRERARKRMLDGALTQSYSLDRNAAVRVLNEALATEEAAHADQIAARIVQLGGEPDFSPDFLTSRSHSEYVEGENLREMIEEDLVAERIAIDSYREMVRWFGETDPTTRRMLEEILAKEEEHADELADLLQKS